MSTPFRGKAKKIEDVDLPRIGHRIGVDEDVIHAVLDVESSGSGFDGLGRPKMLFEPHIFYRQLGGQLDKQMQAVKEGLAYKSWKRNYPAESYTRLAAAIKIDRAAAMRSASWGLGQIMGFNHGAAGYATVEDMVRAFMDDEEAHLEAMIQFIITNHLDDDLRRLDWAGFARGYNGAGYKQNSYHTRLAKRYAWWKRVPNTPWGPDDALVEELAQKIVEAEKPSETPAPADEPEERVGLIRWLIRLIKGARS
jgi:hypothetical protein